jgi:hypothetical protein
MKHLLSVVLFTALYSISGSAFATLPFPFWKVCNGKLCTYMDLTDWEPPDYERRAPTPGLAWERFLLLNADSPLLPYYERWALDWFSDLLPLLQDEEYTMLDIRVRHDMDERTSYVLWPGEL